MTDSAAAPAAEPVGFFEGLTETWTEVLVLPAQTQQQLPPGAKLYRRRTDSGGLSCMVAGGDVGGWHMQVTHVARPRDAAELMAELPAYANNRPPTMQEIMECVNRFTPKGTTFLLPLISDGLPELPAWPPVVPIVLQGVAVQQQRPQPLHGVPPIPHRGRGGRQ